MQNPRYPHTDIDSAVVASSQATLKLAYEVLQQTAHMIPKPNGRPSPGQSPSGDGAAST